VEESGEQIRRVPMRTTPPIKSAERGEAEMMFFGVILIICGIISGSLVILNWVKDTKNAKVESMHTARLARMTPTPFSSRPDPGAYLVSCNKEPWQVLQTTVGCEVLPESYHEIFLAPEPE
jgi:hypothetical protein